MKLHILVAVLSCGTALAASSAGGQGKPASKPKPVASAPVHATVTDRNGVVTEVSNCHARYWDSRQGDQRLAPDELPAYVLQIETQEGRTSAVDELRFPFAELARLAFPAYLKVEITRRNGNVIVIDQLRGSDWTRDLQHSLVERDATGTLLRELKFHSYVQATNKQDGEVLGARIMWQMNLGGFIGKARMSTGREGDFFIRWDEVKSIEFK